MELDQDTHNCSTTLRPGLPGWARTRRNIYPLTPIHIIRHPLSTSSIYYYYDPYHPPCSIYVLGSSFQQPLSRSSLVFLLVWNPLLHKPYISSPNYYLPFETDMIRKASTEWEHCLHQNGFLVICIAYKNLSRTLLNLTYDMRLCQMEYLEYCFVVGYKTRWRREEKSP